MDYKKPFWVFKHRSKWPIIVYTRDFKFARGLNGDNWCEATRFCYREAKNCSVYTTLACKLNGITYRDAK